MGDKRIDKRRIKSFKKYIYVCVYIYFPMFRRTYYSLICSDAMHSVIIYDLLENINYI